jgi:hypothetical protein
VVGGVFQPLRSGRAITACSSGLTSSGTGMLFAGVSRGARVVCAMAAGASNMKAAVANARAASGLCINASLHLSLKRRIDLLRRSKPKPWNGG